MYTPATINSMPDAELINEAVSIYAGGDTQQDGMTSDDVAWVRAVDAEVTRRGLYTAARAVAYLTINGISEGRDVEYRYGAGWLNATVVRVGAVKVTIDLEQFSNPNAGPVERRICRTSVMPEYLREKINA